MDDVYQDGMVTRLHDIVVLMVVTLLGVVVDDMEEGRSCMRDHGIYCCRTSYCSIELTLPHDNT